MKTSELKKNKTYYYTQPVEWVKVTFMYETINGYKFKAEGVENDLTRLQVEQYVEEV